MGGLQLVRNAVFARVAQADSAEVSWPKDPVHLRRCRVHVEEVGAGFTWGRWP